MKRINFLMILAVLSTTSCKKFLDEDAKGLITGDKFYLTDDDAIAAVNGVYQSMRNDVVDLTPIFVPEMISDDAMLPETNIASRIEIENLTYTSQHSQIRSIWAAAYRSIERANVVLASVKDSSKIRPVIMHRVWAEARFIRAFYYFRLVQLFGDLPMMLEPADVGKDNLRPARTPAADVYKTIIEDLQYAEIYLDDTYAYNDAKNGGRATKASAKTLLGKVYLTMAGFPLKDRAKYQLAADKLKEVIDNKDNFQLDLNSSYANIFSSSAATKAADKERIFYTKGVSGMPAGIQAYTRMKSNYIGSPVVRVSTDYSNPYTFTAGSNAYNELTGGTSVPSVQVDDAISTALPIGFTYSFGGTHFDKFYMSSNGFISFITRASSAPGTNSVPNLSAIKDPLIAPLIDNLNGTGGIATYATTGLAPNRILTVQWKDWRWRTGTTIAKNISFQVKLYEANGKFEMIYNQIAAPVNGGIAAVGFRTNNFYCSIRNTIAEPGFKWEQSNSNLSTTVKNFEPGQIFTILPNPNTVYEWSDPRAAVNISPSNAIFKYNDPLTSGYTDNSDDFIWLRYSDVLLMYAEALTELGGIENMDIALAQLNTIRQVHGGTFGSPAMPSLRDLTYSSQENLLNLVRLERRRELAFEAHRWYDLKRWNILPATVIKHLASQYNRPESDFSYINDNMMLFPIPYSDVVSNPKLTQNAGY